MGFWLVASWFFLLVAVAAVGRMLPFFDPYAMNLTAERNPSWQHLLGTDPLGRDVLSRLVHGTCTSARVVLAGGITSAVLGVWLGSVVGFRGGRAERAVQLTVDFLWAVPLAVVAALALAWTGPGTNGVILALFAVGWITPVRILIPRARQERRADYVRFARSLGVPASRIVIEHVVPVIAPAALATTALVGADAFALEAGLGFLGVSTPPPDPSLGGLMSEGLSYLTTRPLLAAGPCVVIVITLAALQWLALRAVDRGPS